MAGRSGRVATGMNHWPSPTAERSYLVSGERGTEPDVCLRGKVCVCVADEGDEAELGVRDEFLAGERQRSCRETGSGEGTGGEEIEINLECSA